jgi:hypothetical protein
MPGEVMLVSTRGCCCQRKIESNLSLSCNSSSLYVLHVKWLRRAWKAQHATYTRQKGKLLVRDSAT